jgi:hypothetical protein
LFRFFLPLSIVSLLALETRCAPVINLPTPELISVSDPLPALSSNVTSSSSFNLPQPFDSIPSTMVIRPEAGQLLGQGKLLLSQNPDGGIHISGSSVMTRSNAAIESILLSIFSCPLEFTPR